jgi:hypothetical protein
MLRRLTLAAVLVALYAWPAPAAADSAEEQFEAAYGGEFRRVAATADKRDDRDLAARLLEAARGTTSRRLRALLCDKAYELGVNHPDGWETAGEALKLLAETYRHRRVECREKLLSIHTRQYAGARGEARERIGRDLVGDYLAVAADKERAGSIDDALDLCKRARELAETVEAKKRQKEIEAAIARLNWRLNTAARVEMFKKRVAADKWDTQAREQLVRLLLLDGGDAGAAARYLSPELDADLRRYVPLAAKGIEAVGENDVLALGDWYAGLAAGASTHAKESVLRRAGDCYRRFLTIHEEKGLPRTKASLGLQRVQEELARLGLKDGGPRQTRPGLRVSYYHLREPQRVPDFTKLKAVSVETTPWMFHHTKRSHGAVTFPEPPKGMSLGGVFQGYIKIEREGEYTFYANCDDGAIVYIDGVRVVANDGRKGEPSERSGSIHLTAGLHGIRVDWFNYTGYGRMVTFYEGPRIRKRVIPPDVFVHAVERR